MLSFKVKNLGGIAEAAFTAAPLTLLIGQNNTGKSYLASLIWALARPEILVTGAEEVKGPKWFNDFAIRIGSEQSAKQKIGSEHADEFISYLKSTLNLQELLSRVFAYDGFADTKLDLKLSPEFSPFEVIFTKPLAETGAIAFAVATFTMAGKEVIRFRLPLGRRLRLNSAVNRIFFECAGFCLFGSDWRSYRSPVYIPAARTGLMLAMRSLIAQTLDFDDENQPVSLPLPISDFLSTLVRFGQTIPASETSGWLETKVLHGKLDVSDDDVPTFNYIPDHSTVKVPLHATSSMITEMAPFIHLIRFRENRHFIFEEPEAHLHLSAQRDMARAIARLLNAGARFTITTHSDTFVQQINNLMRLYSHPDKEKLLLDLSYDAADLINPAQAKAYEFVGHEKGTTILELDRTDEGFVVPSLNETLIALSTETIDLTENEQ